MKTPEEYKKEVLLAYEKKKEDNTLHSNLKHPTYVNIKKECLRIFETRYTTKDSSVFEDLLGEYGTGEEYHKMLKKTDPNIFKPLYNFLRGQSNRPAEKYIELLAWLIDFKPEPNDTLTDKAKKDTPPTPDGTPEPDPAPEKEPEPEPIPKPENPAPNDKGLLGIPRKLYKTITICLLAFFAISGAFYIWEIILKPKCMFWNGDRYQYIACDEKISYGTIILPLDPDKYAHLKRITKPSMIRLSDVGKVHYSKMNNEVMFYTTGGENPVDTARRLLPMTPYIYWKYAAGKKQ